MKKLCMDAFIVGLALFAMFFGAGNIIFPPFIGLGAGKDWLLGFFFYYMADVGLALVAIYALLHSNSIDRPEGVMYRLGALPSKCLMGAAVLCIGPFLAIPRTAVISYEMAGKALFGDNTQFVFVCCYFILTFIFSVKESKLVDIVGRYLTPLLVLGLLTMITVGILFPIGPINETVRVEKLTWTSVSSGYQTLDVLAALVFGLMIVNALKTRGYTSPKMKSLSVLLASFIAGGILFIIYGGLCYLGATVSSIYPVDINLGELVVHIASSLFGEAGAIVLGIVVFLACLTTAIALVGATGTFFSSLGGRKFSYAKLVGIVCFFSALVGDFGLETLQKFSTPVLMVIYPGALVVVVLSLFSKQIKNDNVFKFAVAAAMLVSALDALLTAMPGLPLGIITKLPLQYYGFSWLLPSAVAGILGFFYPEPKKYVDDAPERN